VKANGTINEVFHGELQNRNNDGFAARFARLNALALRKTQPLYPLSTYIR
jgi:hypothetical protein